MNYKISKNEQSFTNKGLYTNLSFKRNSDIDIAYRLSSIKNANVLKHLKTFSNSQNAKDFFNNFGDFVHIF